ncbi:hypothetical protein CRENBAI_001181 [Crenichthys baileyi]|uniref:Uncharacterized protein n=1 Tax=Crenichthys baileyi TaxID=28760 RepID=A0AAV9RCP1_9TELE
MKTDQEYVLEDHGIVLVDYSCTDVVENCMKWCDGLQQFLEMKHQSKLSDMAVITNYMSNIGLLQKYKCQIYGLSGTLGSPRAVLVICETVKLAKVLYQIFSGRVTNTVLYVKNNRENSVLFARKLGAGDVIIATNLAGRGTDLQVSNSVKAAGGLFVVQTLLPKNARVEAQAFGHAARQGSPGSAQLVVCFNHLSEPLQLLIVARNFLSIMENTVEVSASLLRLFLMHLRHYQRSNTREDSREISSLLPRILAENSNSDMMMVKKIREAAVAEQLSSYVESQLQSIKKKEELFSKYLEMLDLLYKINNNKLAESYVSAFNEFWGMWLLTKFTEEGSVVRLKQILNSELSKSIQKLWQREPPLIQHALLHCPW